MIPGYKSSIERLANLFQQSRERWKSRSLKLQKKLRAKEIRIRDLSACAKLIVHFFLSRGQLSVSGSLAYSIMI